MKYYCLFQHRICFAQSSRFFCDEPFIRNPLLCAFYNKFILNITLVEIILQIVNYQIQFLKKVKGDNISMLRRNFSNQKHINSLQKQHFHHSVNAFGKASKPRCQQPSMFDILSWDYNNHHRQLLDKRHYYKDDDSKSLNNYSQNNDNNYNKTQQKQIQQYNQQYNQNARASQGYEQPKYLQDHLKPQQKSTKKLLTIKQQPKQQKLKKKFINNSKKDKIQFKSSQATQKCKKSEAQKLTQSQQFDPQQFQKTKQLAIKKFKQTSRDLSNTAFLTYFNKPPFESYGRGNRHGPGVFYGDYMYSHSVYPHTGQNRPAIQQTYVSALNRARSAQNIRPHPSLKRSLQQNLISGYLTLSKVFPKSTSFRSLPIKNPTKLNDLPQFNLSKDFSNKRPDQEEYLNLNKTNKYSDSLNGANQLERKQISGKSIKYNRKFNEQ